jgi:hypothetical protein
LCKRVFSILFYTIKIEVWAAAHYIVPPHKQANMDCNECSICYDAINATTGVATLSCSHSFHISCIAGWFAKLEKGSCPCCRKEMSALEDLPKPAGEEEDDSDDESDISEDDDDEYMEFSRDRLDALMRARGGQGISEGMAEVLRPDGICFTSSELNALLLGNGARSLNEDEWFSILDGEEKVRWCLHEDGSWVKDPINPEEITAVIVNVSPSESAAVVATSAATKVQAVWRAFKGRTVSV